MVYQDLIIGRETMTRRARRNHSAIFKAKVALEAIAGDMTLVQFAALAQI